MEDRRHPGRLLAGLTATAVVAVAVTVGVAIALVGRGAGNAGRTDRQAGVATTATKTPVPAPAPAVGASLSATPSVPATSDLSSGPSLAAYRGLSGWVDIFDDRAWKDPAAAVGDMASRGVRTIFIETANSSSDFAIRDPVALGTLIHEAHARGMLVVAWYLPELKNPDLDYERVAQAIAFRTPEGQAIDSFALDIESGALRPVSERNRALETLSIRVRELVGPTYPLGAIIPSPVGLTRKNGYWRPFPYRMLAGLYDVFVPMGYYTYHGEGEAAAYEDTRANMRILREQPGCASMPVHLIGGLAGKSSPAEVAAFVRAARESGCIGAGLYDWATTGAALWPQLEAVPR